MNAVIVDLNGKYAAALDQNGNIVKIKNVNYMIGQKIALHEIHQRRALSMKKAGVVAAAAALILSIGTGTAYAMPYGTVSLDAESSIEYTINRFDRVLSVKALNEEGKTVLAALDETSLRFRPVDSAIAATLETIDSTSTAQKTDPENHSAIHITAVTRNAKHTERLQMHLTHRISPEASSIHSAEFSPFSSSSPTMDLQNDSDVHSDVPSSDAPPLPSINEHIRTGNSPTGEGAQPQERETEEIPEKEMARAEPADHMSSGHSVQPSSNSQPSFSPEIPSHPEHFGEAPSSGSFGGPGHSSPPQD